MLEGPPIDLALALGFLFSIRIEVTPPICLVLLNIRTALHQLQLPILQAAKFKYLLLDFVKNSVARSGQAVVSVPFFLVIPQVGTAHRRAG